jgi:hypothetical protein
VSQNIAPLKRFAYDAIGNLLSKSDVGAYAYPAFGVNSIRPHAVTSINGGTINTTFAYDPNGNQTSGLGRTISHTSFNKPSAITNGSSTLNFSHDIDHQRFKHVENGNWKNRTRDLGLKSADLARDHPLSPSRDTGDEA